MKKASEMREISKQNQLTIQSVMPLIEEAAGRGDTMFISPMISEDTIHELIRLGYKISKNTNSIGLVLTCVEW